MLHYFSRFNMEHIHEEIGRLLKFINDLLDQLEKSNSEECVTEIRELVTQFRNNLSVLLLKQTYTSDMDMKTYDSDIDDEDLINQMEEKQKADGMNIDSNEIIKNEDLLECEADTNNVVKIKFNRSKIQKDKVPCPECGLQVKHLSLHIKTLHTPDEEKEFQCQDCGKGFAKKDSLESHRTSIHLNLRPHKCPKCSRAFNRKVNMQRHLHTCTNEEKNKHEECKRARKCLKCNFVVQGVSNIIRHMSEIHPVAKCLLQRLLSIIIRK